MIAATTTTTQDARALRPDAALLGAFWDAVAQYDGEAVWEVRGPKTRRKGPRRFFGTAAGYFNTKAAFVAAVQDITGADAEALYMTLNPVKPALLARAASRIKDQAHETTADADILRRTTLLIDCDPTRPSGTSSTDAERDAALVLRDGVHAFLTEQYGFPDPLAVTMSGNGAGLLYRVDLPNDDDATRLVTGVLGALAHLFDTPVVKVDTGNFNAARITKIIGTVAAKGDSLPERPWRLATGTVNPAAPAVSREALERVVALAPKPERPAVGGGERAIGQRWDLRALLTRAEIGWREKVKAGYTVLELDHCLTSQDHVDGAALFQFDSGAVAYRCLHARCSDKRWADVRPILAPDTGKMPESDGEDAARKPTQAEILVELADQATLFHTPDGETGYATFQVGGHVETWPLRSKGFRRWLLQRFYEEHGKPPGAQALVDALGVLEAKAHFAGAQHQVSVRVAQSGEHLYLDLGDPAWRAVQIGPDGWRIVTDPPVKFRRPKGMLPLPSPEQGGSLTTLRSYVNVASEADWQLYVAFLLAALRPTGPYPILIQHGEQGSAKTTNSRVARSLLDPNVSIVRAEPADVRDLMVAAHNGWCLAFDNLSHLPGWLSDGFCRLATGGGFSTRQLYTDEDEMVFEAQRPVILTGIEELATRGDLLDRALILYLPRIEDARRRPEADFWKAFEADRPSILGALLDVVCAGLRNLPGLRLPALPRMADFARWAVACEPALGWPAGAFLEAYAHNREAAHDLTLESSPVAGPVRALADEGWSGTCGELLRRLNEGMPKDTKPPKGWPDTPRGLSNILRRLAPTLRAVGVDLVMPTDRTREATTRRRILTIRKEGDFSVPTGPTGPTRVESTASGGTVRDDRADGGTQGELFRPVVTPRKDTTRTDRDGRDDRRPSLSNGLEEGEL